MEVENNAPMIKDATFDWARLDLNITLSNNVSQFCQVPIQAAT